MNSFLKSTLLVGLTIGLAGCSFSSTTETTEFQDTTSVQPIVNQEVQAQRVINAENSIVEWKGSMLSGVKDHVGSVAVRDGVLGFNPENQLVSGTITINIDQMDNYDLEGEIKQSLIDHLKSADFFDTENHPEATLEITSTESILNNKYAITADLTIKDITNSIQFQAEQIENSFTTEFSIDRTRWDVRFGSNKFFDNLKDQALSDEIEFTINLELN